MSEATVRCPKCGHEGIVITELLNSDLRLIADSQAAEIERLRSELDECRRLLREAIAACEVYLPVAPDDETRIAVLTLEWYKAAAAAGGDL